MHPKLLYFRHKLFRYRLLERELARERKVGRLLDIGCGDGENLLRFADITQFSVGLDVSAGRLRQARRAGLDAIQGSGTRLPFTDAAFDMIYVAHTLHHVADYDEVLGEIGRCLASHGLVFVVETVTDNPLLRLGRAIYPYWRGDRTEVDWSFEELAEILSGAGFRIDMSGRYGILFFIWELLPLTFWPLEIFTPIFVYLDLALTRIFKKYRVHCYFALIRQEDS